jgi:hypothetical protein
MVENVEIADEPEPNADSSMLWFKYVSWDSVAITTVEL